MKGEIEIFRGLSARPCLNSDQRSGIRRAIKTIYGYPSSWDFSTVAVLCCSFDMLAEAELEVIRDDLILDACPSSCKADATPQLHLRALASAIQVGNFLYLLVAIS